MATRLFVRKIGSMSDRELYDLVADFGPRDAIVVCDRETGESRHFGFVTVDDPAGAIALLNSIERDGRRLQVERARTSHP
jgi:RNA recognition motif-containing protein